MSQDRIDRFPDFGNLFTGQSSIAGLESLFSKRNGASSAEASPNIIPRSKLLYGMAIAHLLGAEVSEVEVRLVLTSRESASNRAPNDQFVPTLTAKIRRQLAARVTDAELAGRSKELIHYYDPVAPADYGQWVETLCEFYPVADVTAVLASQGEMQAKGASKNEVATTLSILDILHPTSPTKALTVVAEYMREGYAVPATLIAEILDSWQEKHPGLHIAPQLIHRLADFICNNEPHPQLKVDPSAWNTHPITPNTYHKRRKWLQARHGGYLSAAAITRIIECAAGTFHPVGLSIEQANTLDTLLEGVRRQALKLSADMSALTVLAKPVPTSTAKTAPSTADAA